MTNFAPTFEAPQPISRAHHRELLILRDDKDIIVSIAVEMYPGWTAPAEGVFDQKFENARETWHGVVDGFVAE